MGNHGVINAIGVIWDPQCLCHYVACVPGPVFLVSNATVSSVYESHVSREAASTFEG